MHRLARPIVLLPFLAAACGEPLPVFVYERVSNPATFASGVDGLAPGGDRENSYAWCMDVVHADDGDWLYVGSSRDLLYVFLTAAWFNDAQIRDNFRGDIPIATDIRARVFRRRLDGTGDFEEVYRSPALPAPMQDFSREIGYRGCMTYASPSGTALYMVTVSPFGNTPSRVLRFPAGFRPGDAPVEVLRAAPAGDLATNTLRSMAAFDGRMMVGTQVNDLYAAVDPPAQADGDGSATEGWTRVASDDDFGGAYAAARQSIWQTVAFNGWLYVVLGNVEPDVAKAPVGFQVFKGRPALAGETATNAATGWRWEKVVGDGARYPAGLGVASFRAASLTAYKDRVYVGSMDDLLGPLVSQGIAFLSASPPRAAQIYRFDASDRWELVIGDPDATFPARIGNYRAGFFVPLPAQGMLPAPYTTANFSMQTYVWWMAAWEGYLFAATFDFRVFLRYADDATLKALRIADAAERASLLDLASKLSLVNDDPPGFDLYVTDDGVSWWPVTRDGFGDPDNYGGRSLRPTPQGLFIGTANPFFGAQVWRMRIER